MELTKLSKKELKSFINENGFFSSLEIVETNTPNEDRPEGVPEGATWFSGIASTEELNRNGYIIRENAWKGAIKEFMDNPVLLLQHNMKEPIGKVMSAKVTEAGLEVTGYIFDDMTGGRFSKGLINALSTGHLTVEVEFENSETNEIISEEEFRKLSFEEQMSDKWTMAVNKLEWVELSLVTVPSNRKSFITNRELVRNYVESLQKNEEEADEEVVEEIVEEVEEVEEQPENTEEQQEDEKEGEIPSTAEVAENAVEVDSDLVQLSRNEFDEARETIRSLATLCTDQKNEIAELRKKNGMLEAKLNSIPKPKGLAFKKEEKKVEKSWLAPLLSNI